MTKQEIIDAIKSKCIPIYDDVVGYDFDWIADTLFAKIEQEKKDTLKEFVEWVALKIDDDANEKYFCFMGFSRKGKEIDKILPLIAFDALIENFIKEREK